VILRKKSIGILLIVLGILICLGLITYQYLHCVNMWHSDKSMVFSSAAHYFFEVSSGAIMVSVLSGGIPVIAGIELLRKLR